MSSEHALALRFGRLRERNAELRLHLRDEVRAQTSRPFTVAMASAGIPAWPCPGP